MAKVLGMNAFTFTLLMRDGNMHQVYILNSRNRDEAIDHMNKLLRHGRGVTFFQPNKLDTVTVSMGYVFQALPH